MADIPPLYVKLEADVSQLKEGLANAQTALKNLDDNVQKTSTGFNRFTDNLKKVGAALGATFAASQVVSFFQQSINAAMEAQSAQTRLREILLNTAGATEAQIAALDAQAEALSKVGIASKESISVTQSQLATFDLQGKTIKNLTPAILDYVAAEKGASATTDDYKQMTNGLAQALQGNFAALTRVGFVLDEDTKKKISNGTESQRAAAITEVLNSTYKDFNKTLAETPEGRMIKLKQEFGNLQQEIGTMLLPVMESFADIMKNNVLPTAEKLLKFIKDNKTEIKAFVTVLALGATAWGIYTLAVKRAEIQQKLFNLAAKANPIGLIITSVALLVAWMVKLFNTNEDFRKAVLNTAKVALTAFASVIPIIARVAEAIANVVTGPMRAFLTALSKLPGVGKYVKSALDVVNQGIAGISDMGDAASKKAKELATNLDKLAKEGIKAAEATEQAGKKAKDVWAGSKDPAGDTSKQDKARLKKLEKLEKDAQKITEKINAVRAKAEEDKAEALDRLREREKDATDRYNETVKDLEERRNDKLADLQERFEEQKADLKKRRDKAEENATKRHTESVLNIYAEFDKRKIELEKTRDKKIADLQEAAQKKTEEITKRGSERLAAIVEKSRERLRSAWQSGTQFSLADLFGMSKEKNINIVEALRQQLTTIRNFQKGAGELAGAGFSQTFLEEIVKAGPSAGLEMIKQIKALSPDQQKELKDMYGQLETLNAEGMNVIANTLSTSSKLATKGLTNEYQEAQAEIAEALASVNSALLENIAEATAAYEEAFGESKVIRDERLKEAKKTFDDAMAESKKEYDEALADATESLRKAEAEAKKTFDKGLLDAQETLASALLDAQTAYQKSLDEIDKKTQEKVDALLAKLAQAAALMRQLGATNAANATLANAPRVIAPSGFVGSTLPSSVTGYSGNTTGTNVTVQQSFTSVAPDVATITAATLSAINYGTAMVAV